MEVIYIDELFAINLIIDYLTALAAARVCGVLLRRWRYLLAAVFGALYSAAILLPGWGFLSMPAAKIACGVLMALIAFAGEPALIKCTLAFLAVSAAFGGAVWAFSMLCGGDGGFAVSPRALALSFAVCYAAVSLVFRRAVKKSFRQLMTVAAVLGGRSAVFRALRDTGNGLYDPISGAEVVIASAEAVIPLFPPACESVLRRGDPVAVMEGLDAMPGFKGRMRLIPYRSVGVPSGLLPVFRPDSLLVDGKNHAGTLIAVSPVMDGGGEYEAVL